MTVAERIRNIRIMEQMERCGMKTESGKYEFKNDDGVVIMKAEIKKRES